MVTVLSEYTYIARKNHRCSACEWIKEALYEYEFTFAERRDIIKARKNKWMIKTGEEYIVQNNIDGGNFYVFKAIPAINDICLKYDIYEE